MAQSMQVLIGCSGQQKPLPANSMCMPMWLQCMGTRVTKHLLCILEQTLLIWVFMIIYYYAQWQQILFRLVN